MRRPTLGLLLSVTSAVGAMGVSASCASFRTTNAAPTDGGDVTTDAPAAHDDAAPGDDANPSQVQDGSSDSSFVEPDGSADSGGSGTVCSQSTCTVTPLISNLYGPAALATDTTYVYWLEVGTGIPQADSEGQFVRLRKDATCTDRSCVEVLDQFALSGTFEGQLIYDNLVVVGPDDACYAQSYNAQSEHSIYCFPLSSLTKTAIDQDFGECDNLSIGAGSILWSLASTSATLSDGSIRVHPLSASDGGKAPALASARPYPTSVVGDGTGVVWTELGLGDAGGAVNVVALDGGITSLATGRGGPTAVVEYAGYVYWIDADARTVSRTARAGGGAVEQIANTDANPFALVVDPTGVYWASGGLTSPEGSVAHAPLVPGGPTTVMMTSVIGIQALAVDASKIFVAAIGGSVNGGGSIVTMPKTR